jgi:NAD(P)-dependent dehydrogenase (short-subunit alcohol dehydrogenase family)
MAALPLALITGGTSGLGQALALRLARMGMQVIVVGHHAEGAQRVRTLNQELGKRRIDFIRADLSRPEGVQALAHSLQRAYSHLDLLVHAAGGIPNGDGEATLVLNYLARRELTLALRPLLERASQSRVILVGRLGKNLGAVDVNDWEQGQIHGVRALTQAQRANDVLVGELSELFAGTRVTVNGFHPGPVATEGRQALPLWYRWIDGLGALPTELAVRHLFWLSTASEVARVSGQFFWQDHLLRSPARAQNLELRTALQSWSERRMPLRVSVPDDEPCLNCGA